MVASLEMVLVVVAGCGVGPRSEVGADGDLEVDRVVVGRTSRLLDGPALAAYCANDSLLTVVAVGRNGAAGIAVRTTLPLTRTKSFAVAPGPAVTASAAVAVRLGTGAARIGISGSLRLEGTTTVSGDFDVALPDSAGAHPRLTGRLSRIAIRTGPRAGCGAI